MWSWAHFGFAVLVALLLCGCAKKPSISGKYVEDDWYVKDRLDIWTFGEDGKYAHYTFGRNVTTGVHSRDEESGTYTFDGKTVTLITTADTVFHDNGKTFDRFHQFGRTTPALPVELVVTRQGQNLKLTAASGDVWCDAHSATGNEPKPEAGEFYIR